MAHCVCKWICSRSARMSLVLCALVVSTLSKPGGTSAGMTYCGLPSGPRSYGWPPGGSASADTRSIPVAPLASSPSTNMFRTQFIVTSPASSSSAHSIVSLCVQSLNGTREYSGPLESILVSCSRPVARNTSNPCISTSAGVRSAGRPRTSPMAPTRRLLASGG